jgi:hypothetical protein
MGKGIAAYVWSLVMRAKGYVQAAIVAGLAYGTCLTSPTLTAFIPGVGAAQAKEFYTRKRVHGRWVSGRFPKKYAHASARRSGGRSAIATQRLASLSRGSHATYDGAREELRAETPKPIEMPSPPREERLLKLQRALEAKAQEIATTTSSPTDVTSSIRQFEFPTTRARLEPRSVSFDFELGLKTTTFPGNVVVRENFDTSTLKGLASPPPGNENLAAARP